LALIERGYFGSSLWILAIVAKANPLRAISGGRIPNSLYSTSIGIVLYIGSIALTAISVTLEKSLRE